MDYIDKIFKTVSIKDSRRIIELYFRSCIVLRHFPTKPSLKNYSCRYLS